jgi:hypothetical protein
MINKQNYFSFLLIGLICCGLMGSAQAAPAAKPKPPAKSAPVVKPAAPVVQPVVAPVAAQEVKPVQPPTIVEEALPASFLAEGGFGGGAICLSLGYRKQLNKTFAYRGTIGYGIGNQYGVTVIDLAKISFPFRDLTVGLGMTYASYSEVVRKIPGLSGDLPGKNLWGGEIFLSKKFSDFVLHAGYSTVLGIRLSATYDL